ncbi:trypsin-like peptidase domain-containing protein [Aliidiomarina indica]|uniref:trypsin-like peptidase domain-containing protein n=1 Tax=Aliidiomarina indica TaxID=2749147 RepID=UPI00188E2129|nr:trypsin-like peptidase domain-containing protein [Aliidiomarina indica]
MSQKKSVTASVFTFLIKPVLLGMAVAVIVLWVLPFFESDPHPSERHSMPLASYSDAFERASPAVVNIYTTQSLREARFQAQPTTVMRLGSGMIMDERGFILTALHVVENVDMIQVALQDGRIFGASLIGSDPLTDLAVLRIDAENLPTIPINRDYQPRTGDVVLAIGNPYNLGQTVTQGIISATGRVAMGSGYAEFIQMDAAINQGNSGGALVNSRGELVGINSASYQSEFTSRGSQGIYFALSYNLALRIMQQLISEGVVTRGYLGITAGQYYHDGYSTQGLRIDDVDENSPAYRAGLREGDFIFEIAGQTVTSVNQGLDLVAEARPGTELEIRYYRGDEARQTSVVIEQLRL